MSATHRSCRRIPLESENELRIGENSRERHFNTFIKASGWSLPADTVEVEQWLDIGVGNRPPIGTPRQSRNDFLCACRLFAGRGRVAAINARATGCIARPADVVGTDDFNA